MNGNRNIIIWLLVGFCIQTSNICYAQDASAVITVPDELYEEVNARTENLQVPWCEDLTTVEYDTSITGEFKRAEELMRITRGNYHYDLYKIRYSNLKIIKGTYDSTNITFYIERKTPTLESGIELKKLWPFNENTEGPLKFHLKKDEDQYLIVSICM